MRYATHKKCECQMSIRNKWLVYNKHTTKHRLLNHAKQTSIDKGILKVGGSDVTKCVFVSSMPEIPWTIEFFREQVM